jgi:hypothetical protein
MTSWGSNGWKLPSSQAKPQPTSFDRHVHGLYQAMEPTKFGNQTWFAGTGWNPTHITHLV